MIKAPSWCRNAVPTTKGWVDSKSGELLKRVGFSKAQISEWTDARYGVGDKHDVAEVAQTHDDVEVDEYDEDEE